MKTRLCLASVAALMLTACPEVHVPIDFGASPAQLKADEWNGLWSNPSAPEEEIRFAVDPARPHVLVTTENDKDDDERMEFHLRQVSKDPEHEDLFFALVPSQDPPKTATPYLLREAEDGVVFFWLIDHDTVEAGIESGALRGKVTKPDNKGSHCSIDAIEPNYVELIKPQYWNWLEPTCIYRSGTPD